MRSTRRGGMGETPVSIVASSSQPVDRGSLSTNHEFGFSDSSSNVDISTAGLQSS